MNQVTLIGRITQDLEPRQVGDKTVLAFTVAQNERWATGERTNFFDVEAWGRQAENIAQYFKKGQRIGVTGNLRQDRFEARDGSGKRSRVKIVLREFEFIEPKGYTTAPSDNAGAMGASAPAVAPRGEDASIDDSFADDDEVPF